MALDPKEPSDDLVEWACNMATGIRLPADRPWYRTSTPPNQDGEVTCRCLNDVTLHSYPCDGGALLLWLGQCKRCEILIYGYTGLSGCPASQRISKS